jgi:hypothetical protein
MVRSLLNSVTGDSNLDGVFDSRDLIQVFVAGEYEDAITGNSTWATGDWNCDGEFTTRDFVDLFAEGVFTPNGQGNLQLQAAAVDALMSLQELIDGLRHRLRPLH